MKIALQNRLDSDNPAFIQCKTSATSDTVYVVLRRISLSPCNQRICLSSCRLLMIFAPLSPLIRCMFKSPLKITVGFHHWLAFPFLTYYSREELLQKTLTSCEQCRSQHILCKPGTQRLRRHGPTRSWSLRCCHRMWRS